MLVAVEAHVFLLKFIILCSKLVRAGWGGIQQEVLAMESNIHLIETTMHFCLFLSLSLVLSISHSIHRLHASMASIVSVSQSLVDLPLFHIPKDLPDKKVLVLGLQYTRFFLFFLDATI